MGKGSQPQSQGLIGAPGENELSSLVRLQKRIYSNKRRPRTSAALKYRRIRDTKASKRRPE